MDRNYRIVHITLWTGHRVIVVNRYRTAPFHVDQYNAGIERAQY
jgi:hypothetical protein